MNPDQIEIKNSNSKSKGKKKLVVELEGLHCADCALNIERSIKHQPGVIEVTVNYLKNEATIYYDSYRIGEDKIRKSILKPGYEIKETSIDKTKSFFEKYLQSILTSSSGLFLALAWILTWFNQNQPLIYKFGISDLLALFSLAVGGYFIFKIALKTILVFDLNVDVLVSIAAIGALYLGDYLEAATVIFIMNLGEFLEHFTTRRTRRAISSLLEVTPQYALVRRNGQEIRLKAEEIELNDLILIKPGERIAIDGVIEKGDGLINQAVITGESLPVHLTEGREVYSGTVLEEGYIEVKATKIGENTTLAQIKRLIVEAENKKAPIQRITDRYARYFIPIIFIIALGVFVVTGELTRAVTILVVACPCALVLGTPTAVVAGIGRLAKSGILVKSGVHLETAGTVNALLLDKTGTLTYGFPEVQTVKSFNNYPNDKVLFLAAIGEKRSEHPIARAVQKAAEKKDMRIPNPERFNVYRGKGVVVNQDGQNITVGNRKLFKEKGIKITREVEDFLFKIEENGQSCLLVAQNNEVIGAIAIADQPKEKATLAINEIKEIGVDRVAMITGDSYRVANILGKALNIDEVYAEMLPQEKMQKVREIIDEGYVTAMVGDGINDGPSLAAASLGIAMGARGTDVAIESSDIALMTDDLSRLTETIFLGRKTLNVIRQNLIFALFFNLLMVILASLGIITIILGAIFHQFSSLGVILNSMRLLQKK